ncbi:hypothetical protein DPSP01_007788 [Paraphaeosphaeria sporulosa]
MTEPLHQSLPLYNSQKPIHPPLQFHSCSSSRMDSSYSRDECVAAIRYYYAFLAAMFMDPSYIIEPPPDGWPNMTAEAMQELGKSRKVICFAICHTSSLSQAPAHPTQKGYLGAHSSIGGTL